MDTEEDLYLVEDCKCEDRTKVGELRGDIGAIR
jgi:hypothetical protein